VISEKPDLVKRFTAAIEKSLQYATDHPDEARAVLSKYTKIEPGVAEKMTLPAWPQKVNTASVQSIADQMQGDGLIKEKFDVAQVLP
jgi:NitT/TauT family transport system substrate-binding protein